MVSRNAGPAGRHPFSGRVAAERYHVSARSENLQGPQMDMPGRPVYSRILRAGNGGISAELLER